MKLHRISIRQFRNIKEQTLHPKSGLVLLWGDNGQGKTSLIEAIYFLTRGVSFRTPNAKFLINKEDFQGFSLEAEFSKKSIHHQVKILFGKDRKIMNLDGKKTVKSKLQKMLPSILFSPESLQIIKDAPQKRRDLVDDLCFCLFPSFAQLHSDYQRILKQKNHLLKKMKESPTDHQTEDLNEHLTCQMLEIGSRIGALRLQALEEIRPLLSKKFLCVMDDPCEEISMNYQISDQMFQSAMEEEIFDIMYKKWKEYRHRETAAGQCLVGPHRHNIEFNFNRADARFFCSQGQQRAIILAFKLAQLELHYKIHREFPILLLDDVLSELDTKKRVKFMNSLVSTKAQIFLTVADKSLISKALASSILKVKEGCFFPDDPNSYGKEGFHA